MASTSDQVVDQATKILLDGIRKTGDDACLESDSDVDLRIASLESLLRLLHEACFAILAKAKQQRNLLASIHRLPAELLAYVLEILVDIALLKTIVA
ncbi:hypothetical protein FRB99_008627 [Tulasnella sp. 403]|nr:hypothetical protein FRB99_008627 [Tulasnella sp. 403]